MRISGVVKYHFQRRWRMSLIFVLAVCLITAITAVSLLKTGREVSTIVNEQGQVVTHVSYGNVAFMNDPSKLINASAFVFLIYLFSVAILSRDRRFLVSLSVPRSQILIGSFLFMLALSVCLAILGGLILPIAARLLMMLFGLPIRGGWSASAILTGNNPNLLRDVFVEFCSMMFASGLLTLFGYVFLRWWKVLLILFGAGIVLIILLVNMIQWQTFLSSFLRDGAHWVLNFLEDFLPRLIDFFENGDHLKLALIQLGIGLGGSCLSYPVMRGMPVR